MLLLVHAPILLAFIALQFHAAPLYRWRYFSRALTVLAIGGIPFLVHCGCLVGIRAAIAAAIIALAGIAGYRRIEAVTRWFRWLALASWCLCILAVFGTIGAIISRRFFP